MRNSYGFFEKVSKEYVANMPYKKFEGKIKIINELSEINDIYNILKNSDILGFDTETRPSFKKGKIYKVSILQLATAHIVFVFRLKSVKLPQQIIDIFENENIVKVGVAIKDDIKSLKNIKKFHEKGFVELQDFVKNFGIQDNGLKKLVANILDVRISKRQQTSNWDAYPLSQAQIEYAATDAWVCYKIYSRLLQL